MEVGPELGRGVRSVVYAFGDHDVVKIANPDTPDSWLAEELRIADSAARAGAPVSARRRLVDVEGRPALVSARIDGPSMWDEFRDDPHRADELGRRLAEIQIQIWACTPSYELPAQRQRIISKIHAAADRHGDDLAAALIALPPDAGPLVLCHGDLHPRNLLFGADGLVVVDWFDASRGLPAADAARTELVLRSSGEFDRDVPTAMADGIERLADSYRSAVLATEAFAPSELDAWSLVQRVARLAEGFGAEHLEQLRTDLATATTAG